MVRVWFIFSVLLLFFSLVAIAAEDRSLTVRKKTVAGERRVALVIGNGVYQDAPLKNPVNDADAMSQVLRDTGFDVILIKNADRRKMFTAIKEFGRKLKKNDVGLFYYAGHGVQVDNANYLLPVDLKGSDLQDMDDLRYNAVPLNEIMDQIRDASTSNIIILDACRDNPFLAKLSRTASRGLAKITTPSSTTILYSTDPGNTASDGVKGENGVFTSRLVESIHKYGLELVDVMREVAVNVSKDTNGVQRPVFDGVLTSTFFFRLPETLPQAATNAPSTSDSQVVDLRYWESAEKSNTISSYRVYLKKFPSGDFADVAIEKIKLLEQTNTQVGSVSKSTLEHSYWESSDKANTISSYRVYLKKFPSGDFVDLANEKIKLLEQANTQVGSASKSALERKGEKSNLASDSAHLKESQPEKQQVAVLQKVDSYKTTATASQGGSVSKSDLERKGDKSNLAADSASLKESQPEKQQVAMVQKVDTFSTTTAAKELEKLFTLDEQTVQDNKTGLMWVRDGDLSGIVGFRNAQQFIDKLNLRKYVGYNDWRLPSRKELGTLVEYAKKNGWGDKKSHHVSDYLVINGFNKILPDYYMTNIFIDKRVQGQPGGEVVRMWSGYFESIEDGAEAASTEIRVLPVRGPIR